MKPLLDSTTKKWRAGGIGPTLPAKSTLAIFSLALGLITPLLTPPVADASVPPSLQTIHHGASAFAIHTSRVNGEAINYLYVADFNTNDVTVFDVWTNTVVATIPVGDSPEDVVVNLAGTYVYVSNEGGDTVSVISTATNKVVTNVVVGSTPNTLEVSGNDVWVNAGGDDNEIDTSTNTVVASVLDSTFGIGSVVNASGTLAYSVDASNNSITVLQRSTGATIASFPMGVPLWYSLALNPQGNILYVADAASNVQVLNTLTGQIVATIPVGYYVESLVLNPAGTLLYVADWGGPTDSQITIINVATMSVEDQIALPQLSDPTKILINRSGTIVYTLDSNSSSVSVLNTTTDVLYNTIAVGNSAYLTNFALDSPPSTAVNPKNVTVTFAPGKSALTAADKEPLYELAWSLAHSAHLTISTYAYHNPGLAKARADSIVNYLLNYARFQVNYTRITTSKRNVGTVKLMGLQAPPDQH